MESPLEQLAAAGIEPQDLARGVIGVWEVVVDDLRDGEAVRSLVSEVRSCQRLLLQSGWQPRPDLAGGRYRSPAIEYAVYEREGLYATIRVVTFLGLAARAEVTASEPW